MKLRNKIIKRLADGNKWEAMYTDKSKTGNASIIKTCLYIFLGLILSEQTKEV